MSTKKLLLRPATEKCFVSISSPLFADGSRSLERFFSGLLFRSLGSFSSGDNVRRLYRLWQWARRRHPNKDSRWLKQKYFERHRGRDWFFFGETCDEEGQPTKVRLLLASCIPIQRHVKVRSEANPYDPAYETYFEKREGDQMLETFRGTHTLRYLWYEQRGLCPACNTKITRTTGWRLHHCVPRVMGGPRSTANRVLLHPECHDRVHDQGVPVSKPRLPERGVQRA
jgi:RNA-directed DNA polymerase